SVKITPRIRPPATARPTPDPNRTAAKIIGATKTATATVNQKASSSERSGLIMLRPRFPRPLQDVDGEEHDYPHDVDEVPVDARHLDAHVGLGREVPP